LVGGSKGGTPDHLPKFNKRGRGGGGFARTSKATTGFRRGRGKKNGLRTVCRVKGQWGGGRQSAKSSGGARGERGKKKISQGVAKKVGGVVGENEMGKGPHTGGL